MPSTAELFKNNLNPTFVETGSFLGQGINNALEAGFSNVISIEISKTYYNICMGKFRDNNKVLILLGDSSEILKKSIKNINTPITFWLDGHWSGADTGRGTSISPIIEELNQLMDIDKNCIIIIDDIEQLDELEITKDILEKKLKEINNNYIFEYSIGPKNVTRLIAKQEKL